MFPLPLWSALLSQCCWSRITDGCVEAALAPWLLLPCGLHWEQGVWEIIWTPSACLLLQRALSVEVAAA